MIALYIVCGIVFLLALILMANISVNLEFKEDFKIAVKVLGIKVFDSSKTKPEKKKNKHDKVKEEPTKEPQKKENKIKEFVNSKRENLGTIGTLKYFLEVFKQVLLEVLWFIKKLKFNHFILNLTIATDDAANTAIEYGKVCAAIYPILSLITSNASVKFKEINISADFNKMAIDFDFSANVKVRIIYIIAVALKVFKIYRKLVKEEEKNG